MTYMIILQLLVSISLAACCYMLLRFCSCLLNYVSPWSFGCFCCFLLLYCYLLFVCWSLFNVAFLFLLACCMLVLVAIFFSSCSYCVRFSLILIHLLIDVNLIILLYWVNKILYIYEDQSITMNSVIFRMW